MGREGMQRFLRGTLKSRPCVLCIFLGVSCHVPYCGRYIPTRVMRASLSSLSQSAVAFSPIRCCMFEPQSNLQSVIVTNVISDKIPFVHFARVSLCASLSRDSSGPLPLAQVLTQRHRDPKGTGPARARRSACGLSLHACVPSATHLGEQQYIQLNVIIQSAVRTVGRSLKTTSAR
jgi:hypothetical protein